MHHVKLMMILPPSLKALIQRDRYVYDHDLNVSQPIFSFLRAGRCNANEEEEGQRGIEEGKERWCGEMRFGSTPHSDSLLHATNQAPMPFIYTPICSVFIMQRNIILF